MGFSSIKEGNKYQTRLAQPLNLFPSALPHHSSYGNSCSFWVVCLRPRSQNSWLPKCCNRGFLFHQAMEKKLRVGPFFDQAWCILALREEEEMCVGLFLFCVCGLVLKAGEGAGVI